MVVATLGCQGSDGGTASGSAGGGGVVNGASGNGGGATAGAGTSGEGGSTAGGGGSGGNAMSARSCDADCAALANTECAGGSFSIATCVPQCQQTAQQGIDDAKAAGCLNQYLALDKCRANDPVCTHPDPSKCVAENNAYIQCLTDAAAQ